MTDAKISEETHNINSYIIMSGHIFIIQDSCGISLSQKWFHNYINFSNYSMLLVKQS